MTNTVDFSVNLGGIRDLIRDLRAVDRDLPKVVLPAAGRQAAELVLPHAIRESPVGATGRLQRTHRVLASQRRAAVAAGGPGARQGAILMFGSGERVQRTTGRRTGRVVANPWLWRALAVVGAARIVGVYDRELRHLLRRHGFWSS